MRPDQHQAILLVAGLATLIVVLAIYAVVPDRDPWPFIVLIGGMLGIPAFFVDARRRNGDKPDDPTPPRPTRRPPVDDPVGDDDGAAR